MGNQRKDLKMKEKNPFAPWAIYSLWYVKIDDPSQNPDLSTSLERPYKEQLNAQISFEIYHP